MKSHVAFSLGLLATVAAGCGRSFDSTARLGEGIVPAVEFTRAVKAGRTSEFTIMDSTDGPTAGAPMVQNPSGDVPLVPVAMGAGYPNAPLAPHASAGYTEPAASTQAQMVEYQRAALGMPTEMPAQQGLSVQQMQPAGDPKFTRDGFQLKASVNIPNEQIPARLVQPNPPPPGSSSPYYMGQMTANPSLWPDEGQGAFLFRDMRAIQPMEIVTVMINENSEGMKRAETDAESKFSILAAIQNFFGEELEYQSDNAGLDPAALINATTNSKFEGEGETKRAGSLRASMSAVVLEVLPNGLLRLEGTRIMSVDHEEEVMVISGLVRPRDVDAQNKVESNRIANMRIDFYGRGVVAEQTFPGWMARLIRYAWPF